VVALQLIDALIRNGGFEAVTDRDLLRTAIEASELVGAPEHRSLLESRDTEGWFALEGLLSDRLRAYVESHEQQFFVDTEEGLAVAVRIEAKFAEQDEWLRRTIPEVNREVVAQEWLVQRFGNRGIYSETSALLLLRPDDMCEALTAASDHGYEPHGFAFFAKIDAPPSWETIESDPVSALKAGVARLAPAWVAVELR
jgi:hypothetical protein